MNRMLFIFILYLWHRAHSEHQKKMGREGGGEGSTQTKLLHGLTAAPFCVHHHRVHSVRLLFHFFQLLKIEMIIRLLQQFIRRRASTEPDLEQKSASSQRPLVKDLNALQIVNSAYFLKSIVCYFEPEHL